MTNEPEEVPEELLAKADERARVAGAAYSALKSSGRLKSHRLLTYRCRLRCMLLDVVSLPEPVGVVLHMPAYKLSPAANADASSAEGRAKNTRDGDRRWKPHTFTSEQAVDVILLNCDHVRQYVLDLQRIQADLDARRAEVVIGTRVDNAALGKV